MGTSRTTSDSDSPPTQSNTEASAMQGVTLQDILSLKEMSLEHDPATPELQEESLEPTPAGTANDDGFIFGAATRLGGRLLTKETDPWTHNAWDNVAWDEEQEEAASKAIEKQQAVPITPEEQERLNQRPEKYWDKFYANVADKFFKDRSWLCLEFQALKDALEPNAGPRRICEIGCGTGATAYPLLVANKNPELYIHALDYSKKAVELVHANEAYDTSKILGEVWSICDPNGLSPGVQPGSVDVVVLIFVLSALHPSEWEQAMKNVWTMLKPGGKVCFRDYGRNDLTQLRFKSSRYMEPNLYARGDKTRVYFFTKEELENLFSPPTIPASASPSEPGTATQSQQQIQPQPRPQPHRFETIQLGVDRRLLMNRKRKLKMYRVWMQGVFEKPGSSGTDTLDDGKGRVVQMTTQEETSGEDAPEEPR